MILTMEVSVPRIRVKGCIWIIVELNVEHAFTTRYVEGRVRSHCCLMLEGESATLLTWWFWLWVLCLSLTLPRELSGSSSSILLLCHWTQMWYSSSLSLSDTEGDLGLCALTSREQPLTSSKLLFKLNMAPMGSVTMSISSSKTTFKELELIISEGCVIFPKSLIGATIQDGGKRERRNGCSIITSWYTYSRWKNKSETKNTLIMKSFSGRVWHAKTRIVRELATPVP